MHLNYISNYNMELLIRAILIENTACDINLQDKFWYLHSNKSNATMFKKFVK